MEIGHFFDVYKELEPGKSSETRGWEDRSRGRAGHRPDATAAHDV